MELLWQSGTIGPMQLKNRVVRSATNEHLATRAGMPTRAWAETQIELAKNEVGLVITGHFAVDPAQRTDEAQTAMLPDIDRGILRMAADGVHAHGGRLVMQLSHSGLKAAEAVNGLPAKGPDDFTAQELDELAERFVSAACVARSCGFDGVQLHCAHGYFLSDFLNPARNHRADEYGGSFGRRYRLVDRLIRAVRAACGPDFTVLAKLDCNSNPDLPAVLRAFEASGADGVEVSGVDFNAKPGVRTAFYLEPVLAAKAAVSIPLILVGGLMSKAEAERVLAVGVPFVSFCRALICESDLIARYRSGEQTEARCLACNGCYRVYRERFTRCVQHGEPVAQLAATFGGAD